MTTESRPVIDVLQSLNLTKGDLEHQLEMAYQRLNTSREEVKALNALLKAQKKLDGTWEPGGGRRNRYRKDN